MIFYVILLIAQQYIMMKKPLFYISTKYYTYGPYQSQVNRSQDITQSDQEFIPKANWFPGMLHAISIGNMNLFELISDCEEWLGSSQLELRIWIQEQSKKNEPLRFPFLINDNENLSKEELASKIMSHIKNGSDDMFFLPSLPINPCIEEDHKKESSVLFNLRKTSIISFPTALA